MSEATSPNATSRKVTSPKVTSPKVTSPKVTVDGLSVRLTDNQILKDISLTVDPHEFVCIIGTSGGGKTSCCRTRCCSCGTATPT